MHVRQHTHTSLRDGQLSGTELLANGSHFSLELLNAEHILVLDCVKVLAGSVVPFAALARAVAVASHLGRPATDTGIDGTTFARSW